VQEMRGLGSGRIQPSHYARRLWIFPKPVGFAHPTVSVAEDGEPFLAAWAARRTGAEDCAPPGRRAPPNERAQGTVPSPVGGTASPPSARTRAQRTAPLLAACAAQRTGTGDCAPPMVFPGRDGVLAGRKNMGAEDCAPPDGLGVRRPGGP
jgi:hypothetical protein